MPVVVCLIEKKQHLPSSQDSNAPRSGPIQYDREVCDARLAGDDADCHSPPVGQLFHDALPSPRSNARLVDFNQINCIFEELFSHLQYLINFHQILNEIISSEYMSLLPRAERHAYAEHIKAFKKNIDTLIRLRELCSKDVSNLDVTEIWKKLLENHRVFANFMRAPEQIDENVRQVSHRMSELYEILNMEEKKLSIYNSISEQRNFIDDTRTQITYNSIISNTKQRILLDRQDYVLEKRDVMRKRIEYYDRFEFPPDHKFSQVISSILSLDISFINGDAKRVSEIIEWYLLALEIEEQYFQKFIFMHTEIRKLQDELIEIKRRIDIDMQIPTMTQIPTVSENSIIGFSEQDALRRFVKKYQSVFSLRYFDENEKKFLAQNFYDDGSVDDIIDRDSKFQIPNFCSSRQTTLKSQTEKITQIRYEISGQAQRKELLVESKATLALCQFYNTQHTMSGRDLCCYLFSDMNRIFLRYFRETAVNHLKLEHLLFLRSKYLFPVSLIEHLHQAKKILCDLTQGGIRAALLMHIKDLFTNLKRAITLKREGFLHSGSFKATCTRSIRFLESADALRIELLRQLRELSQTPLLSDVLCDDEMDYIKRRCLFVLAESNHQTIDKAPLIISHANYIDSDLTFLCLHYLNYAWGYAHRPGQSILIAAPVLIYVNNHEIDDFADKVIKVFQDTSKNITQIIFVFGNIHFVGACLRRFDETRKFVLLDSGDMAIIPNGHLLKIQELCRSSQIEFDDQIAQRKQIGANCTFIALETIAFLSQPNLVKQSFSAREVSAYIAQATGLTRGIETMQQTGTPDRMISPEGQAYANAVQTLITDGLLRLRLRWAKFAQQAYEDEVFREHIEQFLSETLSFNDVILDPELESYCRGSNRDFEEFFVRMRVDCFPLPNIPLIVIPPPRRNSSASAHSSRSSSSSEEINPSLTGRFSAAASALSRKAAEWATAAFVSSSSSSSSGQISSSSSDLSKNVVVPGSLTNGLLENNSLDSPLLSPVTPPNDQIPSTMRRSFSTGSSSVSPLTPTPAQPAQQTPLMSTSAGALDKKKEKAGWGDYWPFSRHSSHHSTAVQKTTTLKPPSGEVTKTESSIHAFASSSLTAAIREEDHFGARPCLPNRNGSFEASRPRNISVPKDIPFSPDSMLSPVTPPPTGQSVMHGRPTFSTGAPPSPVSTSTNLQQGRDLPSSSAPPSPTTPPVILQQPPNMHKKKGWGEWIGLSSSKHPHPK